MRISCGKAIGLLILLAVVVGFVWLMLWDGEFVKVPSGEAVERVVFYDQGWSQDNIKGFYHATQGTAFPLEYKWFLALEQPIMTWPGFAAPPLREKAYLQRFGFLFDGYTDDKYEGTEKLPQQSVVADVKFEHGDINNPDDLPVGFAINDNYIDPMDKDAEPIKTVGLTCGACHTGQLNYQGTGIRIEGGQSMTDFSKFRSALGIAMLMTACKTDKFKYIMLCDPFRFDRFANNVLGADYNADTKAELRRKFNQKVDHFLRQAAIEKKYQEQYGGSYPIEIEGFGRLDALNRIGNLVFSMELYEGNFRKIDAPVSFPHLWGISWFDWVQYNGSVEQPMTRNAGEALGVFAAINLLDPDRLFQSTLEVENLYQLERLLSGEKQFDGLRAPPWPEEFGAIDQAKADKGKTLYAQKCQSCHLPPVDSDEICQPKYWTQPNQWNMRFLKVTMVNSDLVGTDDKVATDWAERFVDTQNLNLGLIKGEAGLPLTVASAVKIKYDEMGLTPEERAKYDGYRANRVRSPLCYKARTLDGIWATPPFLHNGSVPNLYQLLSPVAERDKKFYVTSMEFDPKYVGYETKMVKNGFEFDTTKTGNHNTGHEFRDLTKEEEKTWPKDKEGKPKYPHKGVLGAKLSKEERWQLVEYLKTLKSRNVNKQTGTCPTPLPASPTSSTDYAANDGDPLCLQ